MNPNETPEHAAARRSNRRTLLALGLVAGSYALKTYLSTRAHLEFRGKSVIITGGSRGLGLELSRAFVQGGARVAMFSRDGGELSRAHEELSQLAPTAEILSVICDVTSEDAVESGVARVAERWGGVDVLVNCAGIIQVGPLAHMSLQDFDNAMSVNLRGPLLMCLACLPHLKRAARENAGRGGARIINITSIGGKIAMPHMAPYALSKFGLVGLSDALRAELAAEGVRVLTVAPGTMRTGSHIHALFKGQHAKEFAAFAAAAGSPLISMDAGAAARAIYEAAERGDNELVMPFSARAMVAGAQWFPGVTALMSKLIARAMPGATEDSSGDALKTGEESRSPAQPAIISRGADQASPRENQTGNADHDAQSQAHPSQPLGAQLNGAAPSLRGTLGDAHN